MVLLKKLFITCFALIGFFFAIFAVWFFSPSFGREASLSDLCSSSIVNTVASPNGKRKAVVFTRDCGATTAYSTHVSILPADKSFNDERSIFAASTNSGTAPSYRGEGPEIRVRWFSDEQIEIQYHQYASVTLKKSKHEGVQVVYAMFNL